MGSVLLADVASPPSGKFSLDVYWFGELLDHVEENNLIVDGSKQAHARLLGGDVSGHSITQIGFGTNGTAPVSGNSALTSAFLKGIDSVAYPASNQVKFSFSLAGGEANGMSISEFGLLTSAGTLYARKVRAIALAKNAGLSLSGTWTISF